MRSLFGGLRSRLILAFLAVILLSLALAGAGTVLLLRDQEASAAEERFGRLVDPISQWMLRMQLAGWAGDRIGYELDAYADIEHLRLLLLAPDGQVVLDTEAQASLVGEVIPVPEQPPTLGNTGDVIGYHTTRYAHDGQDLYMFTATSSNGIVPAGWPFQVSDLRIAVVAAADDVRDAWAELLPRLLIAGASGAAFSAVLAFLLADRITRPIHAVIRASEAMSAGQYAQQVEVGGADEVAALGLAFNQMSSQVARSNRSMQQLLANVSHELRTPLTSIQGYAQALTDGVEDEGGVPAMGMVIQDEAARMRALVDDLLYLSSIESGTLALSTDTFQLDDVVSATAQRLHFEAEAAGVTVILELASVTITADERRIEQVLANLLDNAIRHAPEGSSVTVRTRGEADRIASVEVHNGGDPIQPEHLTHLFDRFYQVDPARSRAAGGHSGLGLAIVRELVHAHGGDVVVTSTAEAGTTFTVRLPLAPRTPSGAHAAG